MSPTGSTCSHYKFILNLSLVSLQMENSIISSNIQRSPSVSNPGSPVFPTTAPPLVPIFPSLNLKKDTTIYWHTVTRGRTFSTLNTCKPLPASRMYLLRSVIRREKLDMDSPHPPLTPSSSPSWRRSRVLLTVQIYGRNSLLYTPIAQLCPLFQHPPMHPTSRTSCQGPRITPFALGRWSSVISTIGTWSGSVFPTPHSSPNFA